MWHKIMFCAKLRLYFANEWYLEEEYAFQFD